MKITFGFKGGHVIEVDVHNYQGLLRGYLSALKAMEGRAHAFYMDGDTLINLAELAYLMPSSDVKCLR